jgi:hypothetical protein
MALGLRRLHRAEIHDFLSPSEGPKKDAASTPLT